MTGTSHTLQHSLCIKKPGSRTATLIVGKVETQGSSGRVFMPEGTLQGHLGSALGTLDICPFNFCFF
jgi:hypothetical protein